MIEKWTEAIALADLAANYSTVYDVWCKDMIERRIKMRMKKRHQDHNKKKEAKKRLISKTFLFEISS